MSGLLVVNFAMVGMQSFEQCLCCLSVVFDLALVEWDGHDE